MIRLLLILFMLCFVKASHASDFKLQFPVACDHGQSCWILNYMDSNIAGDQAQDFTCGTRSYDGHEGIDIALRNLATAQQGVSVLAAADGEVSHAIDGVVDRLVNNQNVQTAAQIPCGNGVIIAHDSGWESIYCHMKEDSILVRPGDKVHAGQPIGQIGLSGLSAWPHLGFALRRNGAYHDPYTGRTALEGCGLSTDNGLWQSPEEYSYQPFSIFNLGFSVVAPKEQSLDTNTARITILPTNTPILTLWGYVFGTRPGDRVEIIITDPKGKEFLATEATLPNAQEKRLVSASRERFDEVWKPGVYSGEIKLTRMIGAEEKVTAWSTQILLQD